MRLIELRAKNYRTLQDLRLPFASGYCTISGKNNAGKSCVIRLLMALFREGNSFPWAAETYEIEYSEDKTQWVKDTEPITVGYDLEITKDDDPALVSFVEKIASIKIAKVSTTLRIEYVLSEIEGAIVRCQIDGKSTDDKAAKEIDKRIKDNQLMLLHNSTGRQDEYMWGRGRPRVIYDFVMSADEKKRLDDAGKSVRQTISQLAKEHKTGLGAILGKLSDKFEIEFSPPESYVSRHMPLKINLKDEHVEVPLNDWGSGTQNRTNIFMAVLKASRIRQNTSVDEKITPFVVVEEPESFLHPSAQSEFGKILRGVASELGIQIIVTTHSPYMLNQEIPSANLLLCRRIHKKKAFETVLANTSDDDWMTPFSEHLGIPAKEFTAWRPLLSSHKERVLLVEGILDAQYFEYLQSASLCTPQLSKSIEIIPYNGKDALKNTVLFQFFLRQFDHVFITFDLDAHSDLKNALMRLNLTENQHYVPIGVNRPGKDCIEGLLPARVLATVNGREVDLVMELGSREKKNAKEELKRKYLEEFISNIDYTKEELKEFSKLIDLINKRIASPEPSMTEGMSDLYSPLTCLHRAD